MENKFLDKIILNLLSVLKNGNKEVVSECNEICEISISDTITLNFRNVKDFHYYAANIISFYKSYENKPFNEIIIQCNTNKIKYNFDINVLLVYNESFDKFYTKSVFIVKLIDNMKKLNIEFRCFGYISNDFKFEFTSGSDVYIYVKNHSSKIIIQDGKIVTLNAFYDMQDAILSMFCELKDIIDIKPALRKYVSDNKLKMVEDNQMLLDIISWYIILGGDVSSEPYINFEGIIVNSFRVSENIISYKSNFYTPLKTREKLYYSFDNDSVTYMENDIQKFYSVSDIEKTYEEIIKSGVGFNYRKIFKTLSYMKKLAKRKDLSFVVHSPFFPDVENYVTLSDDEVTVHKNDKTSVSYEELNELRYISEITGYNVYVLFDGGYYEIIDGTSKKF